MTNNKLTNLENINDNSKNIAAIMSAPGVTGKGVATNTALVMQVEFEAQNTFSFGTVTISAASVHINEVLMKLPTSEPSNLELASPEENNVEIVEGVNAVMITSSDNNGINLIDKVFDDSETKNKLKEGYEIVVKSSKDDFSFLITGGDLKIKDGLIKASCSFYSSERYTLSDIKSFKILQDQINLDQSLSKEQAEKIYNEIYEAFPILNATSPVITNLTGKIVKQSDLLLSRTYSKDPVAAMEVTQKMLKFYNQPVFSDIFAVISIGIAKGADHPIAKTVSHDIPGKSFLELVFGSLDSTLVIERKDPLKIIHSIDQSDLDKLEKYEAAGIYKTEFNVALFLETPERGVHELTHAAMNILFNNKSAPYREDNKTQYQKSTKELLLKVAIKIGENADKMMELDALQIYKHIMFLPLLALLAMSRTPDLDIDSFFDKKLDRHSLLTNWKNEYFENIPLKEITIDKIESKCLQVLEKLGINTFEAIILARIGQVILRYDDDRFDGELVAVMADLYYKYENELFVKELFSSIHQYWQDNIHSLVKDSLIIPHQLECNGTTNSNEFVYCVEEFMA